MKEFVQIGGQERPVQFGRAAYEEFEKITGISLLNGLRLDMLVSYTAMTSLVYAGLKWGLYKSDGVEPKVTFTKYDVADWLDQEGGQEAAEKISEMFAKSLPKGKTKNAGAGEKPAEPSGKTSTP